MMRGKDSAALFFILFCYLINGADTHKKELNNLLPDYTFSCDITFDL